MARRRYLNSSIYLSLEILTNLNQGSIQIVTLSNNPGTRKMATPFTLLLWITSLLFYIVLDLEVLVWHVCVVRVCRQNIYEFTLKDGGIHSADSTNYHHMLEDTISAVIIWRFSYFIPRARTVNVFAILTNHYSIWK